MLTEKTSRRELFASFKESMSGEGVAEWEQAITFVQSNLGDAAIKVEHYQEEEMRPPSGSSGVSSACFCSKSRLKYEHIAEAPCSSWTIYAEERIVRRSTDGGLSRKHTLSFWPSLT